MRTTPTAQRPSGIPSVGELPWGSRFCVFHASERELLDALVPFVRAGLENNELCSWQVEAPLTVGDVTAELARSIPELERYVARGQVEVSSSAAASRRADEQLDRAILAGFDGLRLVAHAERDARRGIAAAASLGSLEVIAAFTYPRAELGVLDLMERVQDHHFALVRNSGRWEVLKGSEARPVREALERSEDQVRSLFRNMSEGFARHRIVLDARGRPRDYVFLEVNAAFERLTGLAAQEVLGRRATQVLPGIEAEPADWIGRYGAVALTGEPAQFESYSAVLGRWYAVSAFSPRRGYFAVTFADITDRKQAEAQRRASEARLKLLSDSASLLLSADEPLAIVSKLCDRVMEHLDCHAFFNYVVDPVVGDLHLNAWAGIPDAEARRVERLDLGAAVCGCVARDKQRIIAEDIQGSSDRRADLVRSYGIQAYCCHPLMAEGRLLGTLSFGTRTRPRFSDEDVALMKTVADQVAVALQRMQAKAVLRDTNRLLQEADRRKDEFLAVLSHELRNPLAPIRNSIYILRHAQPGGEQAGRAQDVIERQAEHLTRLVDDLLDVTRIARGKIELRRSRIDLRDLVVRAAEDFRSTMDERGIAFRTILPGARTWCHADPTRVTQVVGNLLHNAAKFTRRGDEVTLSLRAVDDSAELRVRDTGAGIEPSLLPKVFDAFVQGERTLARTEGGLGLGLALVKGIIELHGGAVRGESAGRGQGAEFVVRLPLVGPAPAHQARPAIHGAGATRRVLVVDDNVDAAQSLAEVVEMLGHAAEVAHDGPQAFAKVRASPPDVVLCDIGLPGMSGYEIAQTLRRDGHVMQLFAISGYAQPEDVKNAVEAGFDGHLPKPVDIADIERLLS